jgi:hypothetical protein
MQLNARPDHSLVEIPLNPNSTAFSFGKRQFEMKLITALIGGLLMMASGESSPVEEYDFRTSPIHRAMIVRLDGDGSTNAYYEFDDEQILKDFEKLFAGYREFRQSSSDEWGDTKYRIYMCLYAGRTVKIISDGKLWGVTFGSIPINGDLQAFIATLKPTLVRPDTSE